MHHPGALTSIVAAALLVFAACGGEHEAPHAAPPVTGEDPTGGAPGVPSTTPSGVPELHGGLPPGVSEQLVQDGQRLFSGRAGCFACHGRAAEGGTLGPRLSDQEWIHLENGNVGELREIIRTGVPTPAEYPTPMPPMGGLALSGPEIDALAAYLYAVSRGMGPP